MQDRLLVASLQFIAKSDNHVNSIALDRISKRGYIKKARVTEVTKVNDKALVTLRADGAKLKIEVGINELDHVYSNPARYAEKYI